MVQNMVGSSRFCALFRGLGACWRASGLAAFFSLLGRVFLDSHVGRFFTEPFRAGMVEHSLLYRLAAWWDGLLHRWSGTLGPMLENCVFCRLWRALQRSSVVKGSFLLGHLVLEQGFKRVFLFLFAMYLPLDVLIRALPLPSVIPSLWDDAFLLFGLGYCLLRPLVLKERTRPRITAVDAVLLLFFCVGVFLVGVNSPSLSIAVSGLRAVIEYMVWFFVLTRLLEDEGDVHAFLLSLVLLGTAIGLHGVYQYVVGVEIPATWVAAAEVGVRTRAFSIVGSPNILGDLMVLLAPLAAALAYGAKKNFTRLFYWGCVVVMGLCCLVTFSRGAWVGFAVAVLVFALLRDRRLLLVMLALGGVALCIPEIYHRVAFIFTPEFVDANTRGGRAGRWAIGLDLLYNKADPWLGFGLGRFGGAVAMQNQVVPGLQYFYMDNYYMKTLVEMGYVGLGGYLLTLASTFLSGIRAFARTKAGPLRDATVGIIAAMAGVLAHCFFENIFEVPYMMAYFWAMAGVMVWIGFLHKPVEKQ